MRNKQAVKKILASIVFLLILATGIHYFQMSLMDDITSGIRVQFHEFYNQDEIDTLILGASPVFCGFNVHMMEEQGEENTFSLGTSNQIAIGSYYLLKEALKYYDIDTVIYHTSSVRFRLSESERPFNLQGNYIILDEMKPSLNKLMFAYDALGEFAYVDFLSQYQRSRETLTFQGMMDNLQEKMNNEDYKDYYQTNQLTVQDGTDVYTGKGFRYVTYPMRDGGATIRELDYDENSEQFDYLYRTIELCQEEGIRFIMVQVPLHAVEIYRDTEQYRRAEDKFSEIATKYGVPYWNFNMVEKQYFQLEDEDFYDSAHLVKTGSDKFTEFFMKVYKEYEAQGDIFEKYCYESWEEFNKDHNRVHGMSVELTEGEESVSTQVICAAPSDMTIEYRYQIFYEDQMIEDTYWMKDPFYQFEAREKGYYFVTVMARQEGSREMYESIARRNGLLVGYKE